MEDSKVWSMIKTKAEEIAKKVMETYFDAINKATKKLINKNFPYFCLDSKTEEEIKLLLGDHGLEIWVGEEGTSSNKQVTIKLLKILDETKFNYKINYKNWREYNKQC